MSQISAFNPIDTAAQRETTSQFSSMSSEDFIQIMFTELTNQDPFDPNDSAALLDQIAASLAATNMPGGAPAVHRIPLPPRTDGRFRSYGNIANVNEVVLVPTFSGVDRDVEEEALTTFRTLLPGRKVVGIRCDSLLEDGGLLRCVSLGIPKPVDWRPLFSWSPGDE